MLGYNLHRFLFECWDVGRQHNATKKKSTRILELEDLSSTSVTVDCLWDS